MAKNDLTPARLFELLEYDSESGLFVRLIARGNRVKGDIAGCFNSKGYVIVRIDGRGYKAHRLAWLYATGEWPAKQIDHRDGNPANNRFDNLREATNAENQQNQRSIRNNYAGLLGVSWHKRAGKWQAKIKLDGKKRHLGYFATAELAHAAYIAEKRRLHSFCAI